MATIFKALGDPTRLRIVEFLANSCCPVAFEGDEEVAPNGPTVGELGQSLSGRDKSSSTLSFHLKELRNAGLVTMERRGKNIILGIRREVLSELGVFFGSRAIHQGCSCCQPKENEHERKHEQALHVRS